MTVGAGPDTTAYVGRPRRGYRMRRGEKVIAGLLILGFASLLLWPFVLFAILPGEVGILYRLLTNGTETDFVFPEGIGIKWPWNIIYRYEVRTQARDETVHGLAVNGLSVSFDVTVLFHPVAEKAGFLHKEVGPDYVDRLVRPVTIEAVRDVIGKYDPHELYRLPMQEIEKEIFGLLHQAQSGLIAYEGVVVRDINLPEILNQEITHKLVEEQRAEAYDYIILQAQKEAERKRIQAIGIQTFYSIVADALSPQLLTWRGIEATVEIARSNNAKVVIVGGGKDQLPLILGSDITRQPPLPSPEPVSPEAYPLPQFEDLPRLFPDLPAASTETGDGIANPPNNVEPATGRNSRAQNPIGGSR